MRNNELCDKVLHSECKQQVVCQQSYLNKKNQPCLLQNNLVCKQVFLVCWHFLYLYLTIIIILGVIIVNAVEIRWLMVIENECKWSYCLADTMKNSSQSPPVVIGILKPIIKNKLSSFVNATCTQNRLSNYLL